MTGFPRITHLDDVQEHVEGREDFKLTHDKDIIAVDYLFNQDDTFDSPIRRECRGIKFSAETGEILARPFQKFFNLGERQDAPEPDFTRDHLVAEKLDGLRAGGNAENSP